MHFPRPAAGRFFAGEHLVRGRKKGPPLSWAEAALVGVAGIDLLFQPWALGCMTVWSQEASLALSAAAFGLSLVPRNPPECESKPLQRLLTFPVLWLGLLVLAYVAIQAVNPSWRYITDGKQWWLVRIGHVAWLPSGVDAPFGGSNAWRQLLILSSPLLLACAIWCGFTRRQGFRILFTALAANGCALALFGFIQAHSGTNRMFWHYQQPDDAFFYSSFIYRNHAGAYLNLVEATAAGLAAWHYRRVIRRQEGLAATVAACFAAALTAASIVHSESRMSVILLLGFVFIVSIMLAVTISRGDVRARRLLAWAWLAPAAITLLAAFAAFESSDVWRRFASLAANPSASIESRTVVRGAAEDMLDDRWLLGWGTGAFRYGFPIYSQHYPKIFTNAGGVRFFWQHAHDDLLEFPIELGAVGMLPIAAMAAWAAWRLFRSRFWDNPFSGCAAAGCLMTLVHSWVDFVFHNPAILCLWSALLISAIRWAEIESAFERRRVILPAVNIPEPPPASPA